MLLAVLVHRNTFKNEVLLIAGRHVAGLEDRVLHTVLLHAVLDQVDADVNPAGHFDRTAEGDFAVALGKVQVAHRQAAAFDIHREEHARTLGQILDVAVTTMLAWRHCAGTFIGYFGGFVSGGAANVGRWRVRRIGQAWYPVRIGVDQCLLAGVPLIQQLLRGQAADQAGVHQADKLNAGDMAGLGIDAVEVPDGLAGFRIVLGKKAATVLFGEDAVEAPHLVGKGADVENVDHHQIARLCAFNGNRTAQVMHLGKVNVAHVFSAVIVTDLATGPVHALDDEVGAGLNSGNHGHVGMPTVMNVVVFLGAFAQVDFDQCFSHDRQSSASGGLSGLVMARAEPRA